MMLGEGEEGARTWNTDGRRKGWKCELAVHEKGVVQVRWDRMGSARLSL